MLLIAVWGCENIDDLTGERFYILPDDPVMTVGTSSLQLEAVGGAPPYRWSASDTNIGSIVGEGQEVIYISHSESGVNVITVEDTRYWTATTTITHPGENLTIYVVAGSATISTNGSQVILGSTGGTPPYTWTVVNDSLGNIVGTNVGSTVIYMRSSAGNNIVTVTDAAASTFDSLILQP